MIQVSVHTSLDIYDHQEVKAFGFEVTRIVQLQLKNKMIAVVVDWTAKNEYIHLFKYATDNGKTYYTYNSQNLRFDLAKFEHTYKNDSKPTTLNFELDVHIQDPEKPNKRCEYSPIFFQNLKYGAIVYFGKPDWEDTESQKVIYSKD